MLLNSSILDHFPIWYGSVTAAITIISHVATLVYTIFEMEDTFEEMLGWESLLESSQCMSIGPIDDVSPINQV